MPQEIRSSNVEEMVNLSEADNNTTPVSLIMETFQNQNESWNKEEHTSNINGTRVIRRLKVRRSNIFDVLTPSDIAMLGLNNKRKLLKKVIKLRKKNMRDKRKFLPSLEEPTDNIGEYGSSDGSFYPNVIGTTESTILPKREKIICLSLAKTNDSDLVWPKCFLALNDNNNNSIIASSSEHPTNTITSGESDILHTEESSSNKLFRHYIPPLIVPQTTTKSFLKRISLFGDRSPSSTAIIDNNEMITATTTSTTTTTTENPITFERQAIAYNFVENRPDENSIDSSTGLDSVDNSDGSSDFNANNNNNNSNNHEDNNNDGDGPYLNVYEYPQEPIRSFEVSAQNETNVKDDDEKSSEFYQLIDTPSQTTVGSSSNQESIDSVVILPNSESTSTIDNKQYGPSSLMVTTSSPMHKANGNQSSNNNQTQDDPSSIKDLWQVNRRKKQSNNNNKLFTLSDESENNNNNNNETSSMTTTTSSMIFERYANQQQQQTGNKRLLRIPKLLLPKVNRPAMYSLNGYVPKPSLQRHHSQMAPPPSSILNHSRKNKTRRYRNRNNGKNRKTRQKSKRRRRIHFKGSMVIPWQEKPAVSKMTGKNSDDFDEDDFDDDMHGGGINDMIETSETISNSHSQRRSDSSGSLANSLFPSSTSSSSSSSSIDEKRKTLGRTLKKNGGLMAPKASLSTIPKTSFECNDKRPNGVYADEETGCQVWHICQNGQMHSFLCPIGTVFNSKNGVCDWWYNTVC